MHLIVALILFSKHLMMTIIAMESTPEQIKSQFHGYSVEWPPIGGIKVENEKNKQIMPTAFSKSSMTIEMRINKLMGEFKHFERERQQKSEHWKELEDFLPSDIFERHYFDMITDKIKNNVKNIENLYQNKQWNDLLKNESFMELIGQIKKLPRLDKEKWDKINKLDSNSSAVKEVKNIWLAMGKFIDEIQIDLDEFVDFPMRESLVHIMATLTEEFGKIEENLKKKRVKIIEGFKQFTLPVELRIIKQKNILLRKINTIEQRSKSEPYFLSNVPKEFEIYSNGIMDYEKIFEERFISQEWELDEHDLEQMEKELDFLKSEIEILEGAKGKQIKGKNQVKQETMKELNEKKMIKEDLDDLIKIRIGINECAQNIRKVVENELTKSADAEYEYKTKAKNYQRIHLEYYLTLSAKILSNSMGKLAKMNGLNPNKAAEDKYTESIERLMNINMLTMKMKGNDYGEFGKYSIYRLLGKLKNEKWPNGMEEERLEKGIHQLLGAFNSANEHWKIRNFWETLSKTLQAQGSGMFSSYFPKEAKRVLELDIKRDLVEILYEMNEKAQDLKEEKKLKEFIMATAAESSDGKRKQKNIMI